MAMISRAVFAVICSSLVLGGCIFSGGPAADDIGRAIGLGNGAVSSFDCQSKGGGEYYCEFKAPSHGGPRTLSVVMTKATGGWDMVPGTLRQ